MRLVPAINASVILLMVVLVSLLWNSIARIHLFVMGFLALGLLASVNWVAAEYQAAKLAEKGNDLAGVDSSMPKRASKKSD